MLREAGGAAFPFPDPYGGQWAGMSLLDWFAGQALAGLCADPTMPGPDEHIAGCAYRMAIAMRDERERLQKEPA
jgi:hypothetical protein